MRINEVIQQVDLTKRAIKYYEQEGLLSVAKITYLILYLLKFVIQMKI